MLPYNNADPVLKHEASSPNAYREAIDMQDSSMPADAHRVAGFFVIRAGAIRIRHSWCRYCRGME